MTAYVEVAVTRKRVHRNLIRTNRAASRWAIHPRAHIS